jgi:fructosamine-3-kinase
MMAAGDQSFYRHVLAEVFGRECTILSSRGLGGGCINNAVALETDAGAFLLKWQRGIPADMYEKEAAGLSLLKAADQLRVPATYGFGQLDGRYYLLMEFVHSAGKKKDYWENFGSQLATMHRARQAQQFGLDHDNYIGKLGQNNHFYDDWIEFFIQQRLEAQLQLALHNGLVNAQFADRYRAFYAHLPQLLPTAPASLLHGDLWSGNVMTGPDGYVCLIDPAVYYGHREIELAFTRMFGGFGSAFYAAYEATWPLEPGFEQRVGIYNIYPHMVHVNLFGRSYLSGVEQVLAKYL